MVDNLIRVIQEHQAKVEVTWKGQHGDLPDPVSRDATEGDVKAWVSEAIRTGGVDGINADPAVNLQNFVIERFGPAGTRLHHLITVRPKAEFG
jgi:hypothetical protein